MLDFGNPKNSVGLKPNAVLAISEIEHSLYEIHFP
jgi:hypothetical protein